MTGLETLHYLVNILQEREDLREFADYLPTRSFVDGVIAATNEGRTNDAVSAIDGCERLLNLLRNDLRQADIEWYSGLIQQLRGGLPSPLESRKPG